jgi:uncharacterized protein (DUF111 family)
MILGALLDAGLEAGALEHELRKLELPEWRLQTQRVKRGSLAALYADFVVQGPPGEARAYPAIDGLIAASDVCEPARTRARGMFRRLAEVEAAVPESRWSKRTSTSLGPWIRCSTSWERRWPCTCWESSPCAFRLSTSAAAR